MIDAFAALRGPVRHMKLIGQHQDHKALRARNEQRLKQLKERGKLFEEDHEKPSNCHFNRNNSIRGNSADAPQD